jgi:hypothetical protein
MVETLGSRVIPVALPQDVNDPAELALLPDGEAVFCAAIREAVARSVLSQAPNSSMTNARSAIATAVMMLRNHVHASGPASNTLRVKRRPRIDAKR